MFSPEPRKEIVITKHQLNYFYLLYLGWYNVTEWKFVVEVKMKQKLCGQGHQLQANENC